MEGPTEPARCLMWELGHRSPELGLGGTRTSRASPEGGAGPRWGSRRCAPRDKGKTGMNNPVWRLVPLLEKMRKWHLITVKDSKDVVSGKGPEGVSKGEKL